MELKSLIAEAREKDETFKFKYDYWTVTRKKQPTLNWLMELLEEALGRDYVRSAARQFIEQSGKATERD